MLFPFVKSGSTGDRGKLKTIKYSPYFLDIDIDVRTHPARDFEIDGVSILQETYIYDESVLVFQFTYNLPEELSEELLNLKTKINGKIRKKILNEHQKDESLVEEYTVLLIGKVAKKIKDFVQANKFFLARFIRSLDKEISKADADEILVSEVSYSKDDLTIVDWEGAVIIDTEEDFDSQLELLRIGNYQLLKYRIIDAEVEHNLEEIRQKIKGRSKFIKGNEILRSTIESQLSLLLDFGKIDQSLLLVGDWYSAKLYRIIMDEFYIDDWKNLVRNKLENLRAIDETARSSILFTWERVLDIVQIAGWAILLIGYFYLYLIDTSVVQLP